MMIKNICIYWGGGGGGGESILNTFPADSGKKG